MSKWRNFGSRWIDLDEIAFIRDDRSLMPTPMVSVKMRGGGDLTFVGGTRMLFLKLFYEEVLNRPFDPQEHMPTGGVYQDRIAVVRMEGVKDIGGETFIVLDEIGDLSAFAGDKAYILKNALAEGASYVYIPQY